MEITNAPIIACGGFGKLQHIEELYNHTKIDAISISKALHYEKIKINEIKNYIKKIDG